MKYLVKTRQKLISIMFMYFTACSVVAPYMSIYLSRTLNAFEIGILMSITPICMILFQPFWGLAADRWGTRRILKVSILMTAVSATGFTLTRSFGGIFAVYAVYSLFLVSLSPLIDTMVLSLGGSGYGGIRLWGSVGYGIGVFVSGAFRSRLLGFWSFIIHILLLLAALCIICRTPEKSRGKIPPGNRKGLKLKEYAFLKDGRVKALLFSLFLTGVVCKGYDNFFPVGVSNMKASDLLLGTTWIIEIIPEIILFYYLDKMIGKVSAWFILITGTVAYALRSAILGLFPILWVWIASQPLSSLAFSCWYFGAVNLIREIIGGHQQATGQTVFWSVSYGIGGVTGSFLSGYLVNTFGIPAFFETAALLCILSVGTLCLLCGARKKGSTS